MIHIMLCQAEVQGGDAAYRSTQHLDAPMRWCAYSTRMHDDPAHTRRGGVAGNFEAADEAW